MQSDLSEQLHYAMYMPAISPGYGEMAARKNAPRPMPHGLEPCDLNFLNPHSKLLYLPCCLYSPSNVNSFASASVSMVDQRDKEKSYVLADSGGYQIARGKLVVDDLNGRKELYDWQRGKCDFGVTLDVPTIAIGHEDSRYTDFDECLEATRDHLKDYERFYERQKFPLLNVMQGRIGREADEWYKMARAFRFDGWAFAGALKEDLYEVIRRILIMLEEGRINKQENWIHFLGLGKFKFAVLLTVVRDNLRRIVNDSDFHISMDTAGPGQAAGIYRRIYTQPNFTANSFSLKNEPFPCNDGRFLGSKASFMWPYSPIAQYLTMGDLIIKNDTHAYSRMDMLSACYLMNHNYYVYSKAMLEANELLQRHRGIIVDKVPVTIQDAKDAIDSIFVASDPMAELIRPETRGVLSRV